MKKMFQGDTFLPQKDIFFENFEGVTFTIQAPDNIE